MAPRAAMGEVMPFCDDILEEIFICLPTLEDLGRACASYRAFRRVITNHSFLRRLHALRPPSLLGFFHSFNSIFYPAEPPHPSSPAARAVAEAADFEFSFLRSRERGPWTVGDCRDGRVVLERHEGVYSTSFTTIAVCDPLFRRYKLLPPLPEDLAAAARQLLRAIGACRHDVFLAPCSEEEAEGAPGAFSVIWMAQSRTKLIAFIFSSASGQWREIASRNWRGLIPTMSLVMERPPLVWRSYACGCFYWYLSDFSFYSKLIVLDIGRMEFYPVNYPSNDAFEKVAIVELGENRRGMFVLNGSNPRNDELIVRLFSANNQIHGEGATEWVLENTVSLSGSSNLSMLGVADGKLLLQGPLEYNSEEEYGCILLDFKTGLIQRFRGIMHDVFSPWVFHYIGYPPSLSLPTI